MHDQNQLAEFRSKFMVNSLLVASTEFWSWSVRPNQPTLGASILSLNRYALHFSDVTPDEMADLSRLIGSLERTMKSAFNHNIMNYLMLMMVDHHVHFHVIPRYDGARTFGGLEWIDNGWPALPVMGDSQHKNQEGVLAQIHGALMASASS
ncbi:MAG: HIT family protein [Lysobacter sp.]|nr:MAG: HIT family protein [Lysobacter sp.]